MSLSTKQDKIKQKIFDMSQGEFVVLSEYKGSKEELVLGHYSKKYGYHELVTNMNAFTTNKGRCRECSAKDRTKTPQQFASDVRNRVGDDYIILENYQKATIKIKLKHKKCEHEFTMTPNNFLQGNRCPKCANNTAPTQDEFKERVRLLTNGEFSVSGEYTNAGTKVEMYHSKCQETWETTPNNFLKGKRCPHCYGNHKKNTETVKQEVYDLVGNEFKVLSEYTTADSNIEILHGKCNKTFDIRVLRFLNDPRCFVCERKFSEGEHIIKEYLENSGFNFKVHYSLSSESKSVKNWGLWYDFAIFDEYGEIKGLIEFDGIQHFEPVEFFGGLENFKTQIKNDEIKNSLCKDLNLGLIRIPYWDMNKIEMILDEGLKHEYIIKFD